MNDHIQSSIKNMVETPEYQPINKWWPDGLPRRSGSFHNANQQICPLMPVNLSLVGGWTNPSEKYARQIGSFPQVAVKKYLKPPPRNRLRIPQRNVWWYTYETSGDQKCGFQNLPKPPPNVQLLQVTARPVHRSSKVFSETTCSRALVRWEVSVGEASTKKWELSWGF